MNRSRAEMALRSLSSIPSIVSPNSLSSSFGPGRSAVEILLRYLTRGIGDLGDSVEGVLRQPEGCSDSDERESTQYDEGPGEESSQNGVELEGCVPHNETVDRLIGARRVESGIRSHVGEGDSLGKWHLVSEVIPDIEGFFDTDMDLSRQESVLPSTVSPEKTTHRLLWKHVGVQRPFFRIIFRISVEAAKAMWRWHVASAS